MADKFAESNKNLIQSLIDNAKNKNTPKYKQLDKCLDQSDSCRWSMLDPVSQNKNCLFV